MNEFFRKIAHAISNLIGTPIAFMLALVVVVVWGVTGPLFGFSDTWQLVINTGTTIVTFLVVFMIQNTQNRDSKAIHLKLDEILRAIKEARTELVDLEEGPDEELNALENEFRELRQVTRAGLKSDAETGPRAPQANGEMGSPNTDTPSARHPTQESEKRR
jgi:low affinity Fe/Cu permease